MRFVGGKNYLTLFSLGGVKRVAVASVRKRRPTLSFHSRLTVEMGADDWLQSLKNCCEGVEGGE